MPLREFPSRILITGAARNIGRAVALRMAKAGVDLVLWARRDSDELADVVEQTVDRGVEVATVVGDLADPSAIEQGLAQAGPCEGFVAAAAIRPHLALEDVTSDDWDHVFAVNVRSTFLIAQSLLPSMVDSDFGRMVFFSGLDAHWGKPDRPHVMASKGAVEALTRALALEAAARCGNVTVNAIVPGTIDTARNPRDYPDLDEFYSARTRAITLGRLGRIDEVAATVDFMLSREAGYITGQTVFVTGGAFPLVRQ